MPIAHNWTILATLPSVSVALGQTRQTPDLAVPGGYAIIVIEIDGSAWPVGTAISAVAEMSEDGGLTWPQKGTVTETQAGLLNGKCGVGFDLQGDNPQRKIRGQIKVTAGPGIILAGVVKAE